MPLLILTLYKDDYIIYDKGKIVDYREAVRQSKMTGDDKWDNAYLGL